MEIEKFISNFAEAIDCEVNELTTDTEFKALALWDSMAVLSVIAMVDEYYSKVLTGDQIEHAKTVQDLFEVISK
jgi:acyl carrier protein